MSRFELNENVPLRAGRRQPFCRIHGDIDKEPEGTETDDDNGGSEALGTRPGAGGRAVGFGLSANQARLAAVSGRGRRGVGPPAARQGAGLRRQPPAMRAHVLALAAEERYADFGPTLLAEELGQ